MGRKPLSVQATTVRLPVGIGERIDAVAGLNRRAEFIREATVAELERREAAASGKPDASPKPSAE